MVVLLLLQVLYLTVPVEAANLFALQLVTESPEPKPKPKQMVLQPTLM